MKSIAYSRRPSPGVQFVFPESTVCPFDRTAKKIVETLSQNNWRTPERVELKFREFACSKLIDGRSVEQPGRFSVLEEIEGTDFRLIFARNTNPSTIEHVYQEKYPNLKEMRIEQEILLFCQDESGIYLRPKQGWDKEVFLHGNIFKMDEAAESSTLISRKVRFYGDKVVEGKVVERSRPYLTPTEMNDIYSLFDRRLQVLLEKIKLVSRD